MPLTPGGLVPAEGGGGRNQAPQEAGAQGPRQRRRPSSTSSHPGPRRSSARRGWPGCEGHNGGGDRAPRARTPTRGGTAQRLPLEHAETAWARGPQQRRRPSSSSSRPSTRSSGAAPPTSAR
ncbi:hypothetical protein GQ55_7G080100 [Panicum hallii var. hallii]|uniref:Uncharacterized protein n=1 Tax=Panicum hallii var. hallii TaxID=1504633 RepID=A0A2T7CT37_9POAL|nr:hypothetical protein GQ55_7G080100 [Panicum hallii var. hallii]